MCVSYVAILSTIGYVLFDFLGMILFPISFFIGCYFEFKNKRKYFMDTVTLTPVVTLESVTEEPAKVYYAHPYVAAKTRITVAFKHLDSTSKAHVCQIGIAWCSPKDNFCKAKGREVAAKRLDSKPFTVLIRKTGDRMETFNLLEHIRKHVLPPDVVNDLDRPHWLEKLYGYEYY